MPFALPNFNILTSTFEDFRGALLAKIDLPLHEVMSYVIFPKPRSEETSLTFLQQLKRCLLRIGEDDPNEEVGLDNLSLLLEEHPEFFPALRKKTMIEMCDAALKICLNRSSKGRMVPRIGGTSEKTDQPKDSASFQSGQQKPPRPTCKFCKLKGHEEESCWKRFPHRGPSDSNNAVETRGGQSSS